MAIGLYMDHHVPKAITAGLRLRDVDCLTALQDNAATMDDPDILDRATSLGRALVTSDTDFLVEEATGQRYRVRRSDLRTSATRISSSLH